MSELGGLLELLHGAGRFRTVRAEVETWRHHHRAAQAFEAMARRGGAVVYAGAGDSSQRPETSVSRARLWLEPPDRARVEREDHIALRDREKLWIWSKDWGTRTNVGGDHEVSTSVANEFMPLLVPARVMGLLEWQPEGRVGDRVRARARPLPPFGGQDDHASWELHGIGGGADEYLFELDAASGVVRRVEARFAGQPFETHELTELAIDEPIPPATWVFEAPDGAAPEPFEPPRLDMAIGDVVEQASFTVLAPARVADDWRLRASYIPARARPPIGEHVALFYRSDNGTASVNIGESLPADADAELLRADGWSEDERDGISFRIRRRSASWPQPQLYIERDGTAVMMSSDTLSNDDLIALALSLRPVTGGSALGES
jgi:hypothetical protein